MSQEPIDRGRTTSDRDVNFGATVYDAEGEKLGEVRGFDEHGFYVTATEGVEGLPLGHDRTEGTLGEADLMWRCWECGEMGLLAQELPSSCPSCGAAKEDLYYWTED